MHADVPGRAQAGGTCCQAAEQQPQRVKPSAASTAASTATPWRAVLPSWRRTWRPAGGPAAWLYRPSVHTHAAQHTRLQRDLRCVCCAVVATRWLCVLHCRQQPRAFAPRTTPNQLMMPMLPSCVHICNLCLCLQPPGGPAWACAFSSPCGTTAASQAPQQLKVGGVQSARQQSSVPRQC